jgi:Family of unknown function (DUF5681)
MTKKPSEPVDPTDMSDPLYDEARDPLSPFFEGDQSKEKLEPDSDQKIEDEDKVGPGRPPKKHRWKKGCPSPWPKGRPKKVQSMRPDLKKMFEDALNEKIEVTKADKKIVLTRLALGLQQLATQFARGDRHARRDVFTYAAILGVDLQGKEILAEALGIDHQAIADAFVRRQASSSAPTEPEIRVQAPPDLVDDDVVTRKPDEPRAVQPKPASQPKRPEPPLDQYGNPKPHDRASIQAQREWNIAKSKRETES